jgi:uncharacterized membrane protein
MLGGYIGGMAAAAAGTGDYVMIPKEDPHLNNIAIRHAGLHQSMLALYSVNLLLRRGKHPRTGTVPIVLSAIGTPGLLISTWLGGDMGYHHGMRVTGKSPVTDAAEARLPGDQALESGLKRLGEMGSVQEESHG